MRFFITGETFKTVGEKIRVTDIQIQPKIQTLLKEKHYGEGIIYWGHICICCPPEVYESGFFKEIKKYSKKEKDVELRLRIDYVAMLKANEKRVFTLVCNSILRGVDIAENELKVSDFDFTSFREDLTGLFRREKWI